MELKILTANQILNKLPISLAPLKAGNNSEKHKNEIRQLYDNFFTDQKNLQSNSIKVSLTLLKNGNNLYEHWRWTNEPHIFQLDLTDKLNLKNSNKSITLANLSIYYTWKNIKSEYHKNKFKISAPVWHNTFALSDGFYPISDIQDYFDKESTSSSLSK